MPATEVRFAPRRNVCLTLGTDILTVMPHGRMQPLVIRLSEVDHVELVRTAKVPLIAITGAFWLLLGLALPGAALFLPSMFPPMRLGMLVVGLAAIGYAYILWSDVFLSISYSGRTLTEKVPLRRRTQAEAFVKTLRQRLPRSPPMASGHMP